MVVCPQLERTGWREHKKEEAQTCSRCTASAFPESTGPWTVAGETSGACPGLPASRVCALLAWFRQHRLSCTPALFLFLSFKFFGALVNEAVCTFEFSDLLAGGQTHAAFVCDVMRWSAADVAVFHSQMPGTRTCAFNFNFLICNTYIIYVIFTYN